MKSDFPKVSICIPTYNGVQYLKECIESVRVQSFDDLEIVICDDHSSDETLELASMLAANDSRFRIMKNPKRYGLVANWNHCIDQARGEWIKFVFQDDVISPRCVEMLLAACEHEKSHFGFCERSFIFEGEIPESLKQDFENHRRRLRTDYGECQRIEVSMAASLAFRFHGQNPVGEPTVTIFKKSLLRELGAFDESLIQLCDAEFWWRAMLNGTVAYVPECLASFRIHSQAATATNTAGRLWRLRVLDPLLMHYRLAFDPRFRNARSLRSAGKSVMRIQLGWVKMAFMAAASASPKDWSQIVMEDDWLKICKSCPGLELITRLGRVAGLTRGFFKRPRAKVCG